MRANGARSLNVQCKQCRHRVIVNVDHLPGDLTVPSFGPRMVCIKCGTVGADVRPNWQERGLQAAGLAGVQRRQDGGGRRGRKPDAVATST
jgi:hypothetical protein